jgi:aspartyl-tRNA(Asn)/glutamyl-tRNA(Gln) amidotransferase subunit A
MSLIRSTATTLLQQLGSGALSSVELTQAYLDQISAHDGDVSAFLDVAASQALAQARDIDQRRAAGQSLGRLAGIPIAIKDVLCTEGWRTTCASRMLENFVPPYDATVVAKLRAADAVLVGKTNMDEFAMGGSTENSAFLTTKNPWDLSRTPGGSSGGAAAALAASMCPLCVGTDTGGSIRQPAAFCGVTGLKPSYGRVSRYGLVAFASSLDQVGPLAMTAEDVALLLEVIAGHDPLDSTSADLPVPEFSETVTRPVKDLRVGVVREHFGEGLDAEIASAIHEALNVFTASGAEVKDVSLPHAKYAIATYYIIAPSEASSNLARYDGVHYGYRADEAKLLEQLNQEHAELATSGNQAALDDLDTPLVRMYRQTRAEGFGAEVKRRIMLGTYALSAGYYDAYYLKALKVRRLIRQDYEAAFEDVDLIIGPTSPIPPFPIGEMVDDPLRMYLQDLYTVSANLTGTCALSIPCGFTEAGLPIGLQLQGPGFQEERLLQAAHMYQQETDWHLQKPEKFGS